MKKLSPCYDQNLQVLRFSLDSLASRVKVILQASQRNVLLSASVGTVTKSERRHWETKALCTGTGTRKTWQLEVMSISFYCCCGYWDTVSSPKPKGFPKLIAPMPFPVVAPWTPLSVSTMDVLTQTHPGVPTDTFPTLWTHPFFPQHGPHPGTISSISQGLSPEGGHLQIILALVLSWGHSLTFLPLVGWFPLGAPATLSGALT